MNLPRHRLGLASIAPAHLPVGVRVTSRLTLTPVESALMQVFILKNFKSRGMNTYKKPQGGSPLSSPTIATSSPISRQAASHKLFIVSAPAFSAAHGPRNTEHLP